MKIVTLISSKVTELYSIAVLQHKALFRSSIGPVSRPVRIFKECCLQEQIKSTDLKNMPIKKKISTLLPNLSKYYFQKIGIEAKSLKR